MNPHHGRVRRCTVHHGGGEPLSETCDLPQPTDGERSGLRAIMSNNLVCARADLEIHAAIKLMMHHHIGCLPIVDHRRRPVGILTKFDLVEQLEAALGPPSESAAPADLRSRSVEDVMMPLAMTLPERATVAQAAAMMTMEDTHHVLVVGDDARLIGVISTRDIVGWVVDTGVAGEETGS
jgi:CBS domain-containing protein